MREPYLFKPEVTWKMDTEVEAARTLPGWREFHRACAKGQLFFDHIEKQGRLYVAVAVHGSGIAYKVAEERAKTPVEALEAAYRAGGVRVPDAEPWLAMIVRGPQPADDIDLEDLLG